MDKGDGQLIEEIYTVERGDQFMGIEVFDGGRWFCILMDNCFYPPGVYAGRLPFTDNGLNREPVAIPDNSQPWVMLARTIMAHGISAAEPEPEISQLAKDLTTAICRISPLIADNTGHHLTVADLQYIRKTVGAHVAGDPYRITIGEMCRRSDYMAAIFEGFLGEED
jgi:hypothetical protein